MALTQSFRARIQGKTCQNAFYILSHFSSSLFFVWCPFTEAVCLSDPGLHQALHRSQLATEARQGSLSQRSPGEGGQGNSRVQHVQLSAEYDYIFMSPQLDYVRTAVVTKVGWRWQFFYPNTFHYIYLHFVNTYFNLCSFRGSNKNLNTPLTWVNLHGQRWMISLFMFLTLSVGAGRVCEINLNCLCRTERKNTSTCCYLPRVIYTYFSPMKVIGRQIIFK